MLVADLGQSQAQAPDGFLLQLDAPCAEALQAVLQRQAAALVNPPTSPLDVIAALRRGAPGFAALIDHDPRP